MERFFFRKIEVWVLCLVVILGLAGAIAFATLVAYTLRGGTKAGALGEAAVAVASIPDYLARLGRETEFFRAPEGTHPGKAGFDFSYPPGARPGAGYLLLSRYDGDDGRAYVELVDLDAQELLHRWAPDIDAINARSDLDSPSVDLARDRGLASYLMRHPFATAQGHLLIKSFSPLVRIDACSRVVWINDSDIFPHAAERDGEGVYWIGTAQEPVTLEGVDPEAFLDDSITAVSAEGRILMQRSVGRILIENGLGHLVYPGTGYVYVPLNLNDIEPVPGDGPHWRAGDLFLSLRNPSIVLLYRPATDEVVWLKAGPWAEQHDVDVLDERRIAVFSNNARHFHDGARTFRASEVLVHDLATGETASPWRAALERLDLRTVTEGAATVLADGGVLVEESVRGRLVRLDAQGAVVWDYVNRAEAGGVYRLGWSRLIGPERGARIAAALARADCAG